MADIYVLIYVTLIVLIFNLISLYIVLKKQRYILSDGKKYLSHKKRYLSKYVNKIESKLFNLGYPYKLTTKKYLVIKYIVSILVFIISYFNYKSFKVPSMLLIIIFLIPDYLVYSYTKKERNILIGELRNIVNSMIICLSSYATLKDSLILALESIKYKRFKESYEAFVNEYNMNGYRLNEPSKTLERKFNTYELSLFLGTLLQGEKEGSLLEGLEKYKDTLELNYFKYLKQKAGRNLLYVTLGTVLSLINIVIVVMYPILVQVLDSLQLIFS